MWPSPAFDLYPDSIVLDARGVASDRLLSRPSQHVAGRDVELAAVAGTRHYRSLETTLSEGTLKVRARISEGVERAVDIRDRNAHSADVERLQPSLGHPSCICHVHELTHSLLLSSSFSARLMAASASRAP
jgi:hypothetical protein